MNVSLDSLDTDCYRDITGHDRLSTVLDGIEAGVGAGLTPIKLNMVLLSGVNEDEVEDFLEFVRGNRNLILQLIELMEFTRCTSHGDIDRVEVVSGPASALDGPNAANGVVHVFTRSPFDAQGTTVSLAGGEQNRDAGLVPALRGVLRPPRLPRRGPVLFRPGLRIHHPQIPVIMGGYSATYFHQELAAYPQVDVVVRGDSTESTMLQLISALKKQAHWKAIPGITYKEQGLIRSNPAAAPASDLNHCSNNYLSLFKNSIKFGVKGFTPIYDWWEYPITAVMTCRGCTQNCVICGGSKYALKKFCNREEIAYRSPGLIVDDMRKICRYPCPDICGRRPQAAPR